MSLLLRVCAVHKVSLAVTSVLSAMRIHEVLALVHWLREGRRSCGVDTVVGRIVISVIVIIVETEVQMQAIVIRIHLESNGWTLSLSLDNDGMHNPY